MTSLAEVVCHIPETAETVQEAGDRLRISAFDRRLFEKFLGLREIRVAPDRTYSDRLVDAAQRLQGLPGKEDRVRYFIAARTFRDAATASEAPVHAAADRLGLRNAVAFSVTEHACASGLLALWTAGWLLRDEDPDAMALLVTGELAPVEGFYLPQTAIMGDSSAACLITADGPSDQLLSYAFRMSPGIDEILKMAVMHSPDMGDVVTNYSSVSLNEFKKFYTEKVVDVVQEAIDDAGVTLDQCALILPQNINRISWVRICRRLNYPVELVMLDYMPVTGHCYAADGFINYTEAVRQGRLRPGDYYLVVSVGMGGGFAAMVLRH
ncbi:3-oxoacyl-[acyl-carrier-protein] synthase III C-terminal domain-containing protein [Micromonospora sp. NPDC050686]|uniref:3-oxoacyl-[acyl-carrier-protein] synthase III C-terminal domain-containing protein n=1 Tax=Micromonospora sp. NPDC050686 TaxID=3154631 RepID=UPI0033E02347